MTQILFLLKHITQYLACGFLFVGGLSSFQKKWNRYLEIVLVAIVQTLLTVEMQDYFPSTFLGVLMMLLSGLYYSFRGREKLIVSLLFSLNIYTLTLYGNMLLGLIAYFMVFTICGERNFLLTGIWNLVLFIGATGLSTIYLFNHQRKKLQVNSKFYSFSILCGIILTCNIAVVFPEYMSKTRFEWVFSLVALISVAVILVGAHESRREENDRIEMQDHIRELSGQVHHFKEYLPAVKRICEEQLQLIRRKTSSTEIEQEFIPLTQEIEELLEEQMKESRTEFLHAAPVIKTGVLLLDALLLDFQKRMEREDILFQVGIYTSPAQLIREGKISQSKLMELLGDLLANSMHSILRKEIREEETIELNMGISQESGFYEIDCYDSGVPFDESILKEFGKRGLTTGGTGEGLANMMDTLQRYQISLTITEYEETEEFSKCMSFCFSDDFEVAYSGHNSHLFHLYIESLP